MADMAADLTSTKIVLFQALVRGFLVRRKLLEVRKEFEEVLNDLEKDTNFVCWKTKTLGLPLISSDPKVLNGANKETKEQKENGDEVKQRDSVEDEFGVKLSEEFETMVNTGHGQQVNRERSAVDEEPVLECPASGASNSESNDIQSDLLQINQAPRLENSNTISQVHTPGEEAICSGEQSSGKRRYLIPNSDTTTRCTCPDERCSRRVPDLPFPLNSTLKRGSGHEGQTRESVGRESTSETSLQSYLQGGTLHLREETQLSETWLTDRSFDTILGEDSSKGLPTDPVKLRELREHIGMELLWTEQAIQSRKKYLGLRKGLAEAEKEDPTINWE